MCAGLKTAQFKIHNHNRLKCLLDHPWAIAKTHVAFYPNLCVEDALLLSVPSNVKVKTLCMCSAIWSAIFHPPPLWAVSLILSEVRLSIKWRPLDIYYIKNATVVSTYFSRLHNCSACLSWWSCGFCKLILGHLVLRTMTQKTACLCVLPPPFPQQSPYFSSTK